MTARQNFSLSSQLSDVHRAARALQTFATQHDIPEEDFMRMQQAMIEWLNNVIEHGNMESRIKIEFSWSTTRFTTSIRDQNPALPNGFAIAHRDIPDPAELPEGGWGMMIIQAMVDQITLQSHDHGNTMQLSLLYDAASQEQPHGNPHSTPQQQSS